MIDVPTGNDHLHSLTSRARYRLRVDLADASGERRYAEYDNFTVASEADKYRMTYGAYQIGNFTSRAFNCCFKVEVNIR